MSAKGSELKRVRQKAYGTMKQPNEIDGLRALRPMMEGLLGKKEI